MDPTPAPTDAIDSTKSPAPAGRAGGRCPFARLLATPTPSIGEALRTETRAAHERAEHHPRQARLVRGQASRAEYAEWLGQMRHLWRAVDASVLAAAARDGRVKALWQPYHPHAGRVDADLRHLGCSPDALEPVRPAADFSLWLLAPAATAAQVVGAWYVLEGSSNGGRFIAKAVSRSLDLPGPDGLQALDPHGEAQRERWAAWKSALDAQPWSAEERHAMVAAASRTFDAVYEVMDAMPAPAAPAVA